MRYSRVYISSLGYELAPNVVTSAALEARLAPVYQKLSIRPGQLEALTGIRERRWWDNGQAMSNGATKAARKALQSADLPADDVEMLIYAGVCRDNIEPATACAVAHELRLADSAHVYDVSNACLGVLNGMIQVANAIELGQIKAGLIVSCESARPIMESTINRLLENPDMEMFKKSVATLTGGSGAIAVLLTDGSYGSQDHRLVGGVHRAAPEHHKLCRWGADNGNAGGNSGNNSGNGREVMETDAPAVLHHGVILGSETWKLFLRETDWATDNNDVKNIKTIAHQVGTGHRSAILEAIGIDDDKDYTTFAFLGNIGTVSLPITLALADERGFIEAGDRVALLGIGSGLNCLMLAIDW